MKLTNLIALALSTTISINTYSAEYCLGIRGNGLSMPAHWGGIARLVEDHGVPAKMAGGSSGTITMFLMESIFANKSLSHVEHAFLIKSLEGLFYQMMKRPEVQALIKLSSAPEIKSFVQKLTVVVTTKDFSTLPILRTEFLSILSQFQSELHAITSVPGAIKLINPELIKYVIETNQLALKVKATPDPVLISQLQFHLGQIKMAIETFGKFEVATDNQLFFRPGLIDFSQVAEYFGTVADFYLSVESSDEMMGFVKSCSLGSKGKTWRLIVSERPECQSKLEENMNNFLSTKKGPSIRLRDQLGKYIQTIPATSILKEQAAEQYMKMKEQYTTAVSTDFGLNFAPSENDVVFGYWGSELELAKVEKYLNENFSNDSKSRKFFSLGNTEWKEVLRTSPAEPGLANVQKLNGQDATLLSAGGWADLHPVQVLRASGCEEVIYLTRRDGDALFGQGVAKRLLGFEEISWQDLTQEKNNLGSSDVSSDWSSYYNVANPNSSYASALSLSDAILCTNWNSDGLSINLENGITALIEDAYFSPAYYNPGTDLHGRVQNQISNDNLELEAGKNWKKFVGCIPGVF